jgi:D-alanine-D-alanine ligase
MDLKKALIFHSKLLPGAPPDELDVLEEAAFFKKGLQEMNVAVKTLPFENDLDQNIQLIRNHQPDIIVNLVETIYGDGRLIHVAPVLFEHLKMPFTGCTSESIYLTSNKLLSKKLLSSEGILTPSFFDESSPLDPELVSGKFLLKSLWEHASFGMDEHNPVFIDSAKIIHERLRNCNYGYRAFFAEEYIDGREFNVSIIGNGCNPRVLPPAEIKFLDYPVEKPKVVGYRAKWDENSFEYKNTVRVFLDTIHEKTLLERINEICLKCWKIFDLRGYARVDFRMDQKDNLYVLEINSNPCISEDSGFVAAARQAHFSDKAIVGSILQDSIYRT